VFYFIKYKFYKLQDLCVYVEVDGKLRVQSAAVLKD